MTHPPRCGSVVFAFRLRVTLPRTAAAALLCVFLAVHATAAQSLGHVAQREAERRKQVASGRAYTNADLTPVDAPAPPAAPVPTEVAPVPAPETPATRPAPKLTDNPGKEPILVEGREKRDEQYWRTMARDVRARLAKLNAAVAAHEARIAAIDAGPQTPTEIREREVLSGTLIVLRKDTRLVVEGLTRFLTRAQLAKIPEEWFQ